MSVIDRPDPVAEPVGILSDEEDDLTLFAFDEDETLPGEDERTLYDFDAPGDETVAVPPISAPFTSLLAEPAKLAGRYVVGDLIGRGGLCEIFAVFDTLSGPDDPPLVVKRLRTEHRGKPDAARTLTAQGALLACLSHPTIVRYVAAGEESGDPWLVMERVAGTSLGYRLRQSPGGLEREAVSTLLADLIAGLEHIHGQSLVHGDLKPGNILLGDDGRARLADPLPPNGRDAVAITPLYASPERMAGRRPATADDVYALALVAYEALTGRHPFDRIPPAEALDKRMAPLRPEGLDRTQWRFLSRLLTGEARWSTPASAFAILTRPPRRRGRLLWGVAVSVALLAAAVVLAVTNLL